MKFTIKTPVALTVIARTVGAAVEAADAILPAGQRVLASAPSSSSEPRLDLLGGVTGLPVTDVLLWAPDLTTPPAFARMVKNLPDEWHGCSARRTVLMVGGLSFTGLLRGGAGDFVHGSAVRLGGDVAIVHDGLVRIERATGGAPAVSTCRLLDGSPVDVPDHEWSDAVAIGVDRAVTGLLRDYPSLLEVPKYSGEDASLWYESVASIVGAPVALVAPVLDRVRAVVDGAPRPSTANGDDLRAVVDAAEAVSGSVPAQALRDVHRADAPPAPSRPSEERSAVRGAPETGPSAGSGSGGPALPMSYRRLRQQIKGVGPTRRRVLEYANLTAVRRVAGGEDLDEVEATTAWPAPDAHLDAAQEAELKEMKAWMSEWRRTADGRALEDRLKERDAVRWAPSGIFTPAARGGVSE